MEPAPNCLVIWATARSRAWFLPALISWDFSVFFVMYTPLAYYNLFWQNERRLCEHNTEKIRVTSIDGLREFEHC